MAEAQGLSQSTVTRIWRQHNLKPHLVETFKTQQRQTFFRETPRCGRSLFKSSRQSSNLMCRREKSNPGTGTHQTLNAVTSRHCGPSDTRLYPPWDDNFIRDFKHDRWQSHRRLYAPPQASGIHPVPAIDQCQNSNGFGPASYCRQLRDSQTCSREGMAETPSQIPFAFYSNIQFMAQHGRTLVPRNHRQADSRGSFKNVPELISAITQYLENHNQNPHVFIWSASVERIMSKISKCKEALDSLH